MIEIHLPLSITYETQGITPISDVVAALQATDAAVRDAVSLLPSLFDGLVVEQSSLSVRSITQQSPLRELFIVSLIVTFQDDLSQEVPPMIEDLLKIKINENYDTLVTVVFMIVLFYGAGMAVDLVKRAYTESLPRQKLEEIVQDLAIETGKSGSDIRSIVERCFDKPTSAQRVVKQAKNFFLPSQRDGNSSVRFDRAYISSDVIREIPYVGESDDRNDFNRYRPFERVELSIHAQDKDKSSTGWAAVANGIVEKRLKLRVLEPVAPSDLWQKDSVTGDIVIVEKLTSFGYMPTEIHLTKIHEAYPKNYPI